MDGVARQGSQTRTRKGIYLIEKSRLPDDFTHVDSVFIPLHTVNLQYNQYSITARAIISGAVELSRGLVGNRAQVARELLGQIVNVDGTDWPVNELQADAASALAQLDAKTLNRLGWNLADRPRQAG